jgi:hypothetical protein
MPSIRRFLPLQHSLTWLVWLALLLPMAQSATAWHGYSHMDLAGSGLQDGKQSPHAAHCDLCLTAAAVASGALVGGESKLLVLATHHELPREAASNVWLALPTPAYRSRAPPLA